MKLRAGCLAGALLVAPVVCEAQARVPRVAVGPFSGTRVEIARSLVASALQERAGEIEFVGVSEYNTAAEGLGYTGQINEEALSAVGRELHVDAVIVGSFERRGTSWRLQVRILRGRDARSEGTASWEVARAEELMSLRPELWDQLSTFLRVDNGNEAPPPRGPVGRRGGSEGPSGPEPGARAGTLGWLEFQLGGGLASRSWRLPVLGEATPRGYENSAYGELQGRAAAYLRWNGDRLGVGLEFRASVPVGLSSLGRSTDLRVIPLATSAAEVLFGASLALRPSQGGFARFGLGVVFHSFSVDTARLVPEMRLAKATYVGLRVGGEAMIPLIASGGFEFGPLFGGELRWVGVGSEQRQAFGSLPGTTLGLGTWLGLCFTMDRIAPGLGLRAVAEFVRYRTNYAGPAAVGTVSDAVDDFTRFIVAATYALGAERPAGAR
ncbi:MAG: hypothetical protein HY909_29735 [Deltaproteobacteria bacterium]|nr:hypothetical protein [Deltaproteobacteria bacterium]